MYLSRVGSHDQHLSSDFFVAKRQTVLSSVRQKQKRKAKRAAYMLPHSASSTLWAVYKLIMQATHCPPQASWVLILLISEG